jgi:glycosyltransferase involved in cell wall biosynthesis
MTTALSVIIPVTERATNLITMHDRYDQALRAAGVDELEFIYVVAPYYGDIRDQILQRTDRGDPVTVIELTRNFGEATAIKTGAQHARHELIMTLPPYEQIAPEALGQVLAALEDNDVVAVRRWPRFDSKLKQVQSNLLHGVIKAFTKAPFGDVGCGVRLYRKSVFEETTLYGDFHRFLPMLAYEQGFVINVLEIPQSQADAHRLVYSPGTYLSRVLDVLTVVFLTKFNKRPLRFFGAAGAACLLAGMLGLAWIGAERMFFDVAAGDRPAMVLFILALALGVQLAAIGLVGETLIFTHAKDIKEYKIKRIYE